MADFINCSFLMLATIAIATSTNLASPGAAAQSNVRERVAAAVETIEGACASDVRNFCDKVTRAEGRLLSCMQAHDDQLSRKCQLALYRVSRNVEGALNRVGRIADACWADIEANCRDAQGIGRCVLEKRSAMSQSCQTVVTGIKNAVQGLAALRGLPAVGSDNTDLGDVVGVTRSPDGEVQSIQIEMDQKLGMGGKIVNVGADRFEQIGDRVRILLGQEEMKALPAEMMK